MCLNDEESFRFFRVASRPGQIATPVASRSPHQPYLSCLRFPCVFLVFANAAVPTRPRGFFLANGTPRGSATHEAARDRPEEGFCLVWEIAGARFGGRREGTEGAMFLLASASGIARFATLTLGGRDGGETRGPAGQAGLRHASAPASPGVFTSLMRRAPRAAAPRWVAARASPGGRGGGGGSSYGGNLSMDSSRDDSGAR